MRALRKKDLLFVTAFAQTASVICAALVIAPSVHSAEQPTASDLVAGYRYNVAAFRKCRITWLGIQENKDAWFRVKLRRATALANEPPSSGKATRTPKAVDVDALNSAPRFFCQPQDLWTDGISVQVRTPIGAISNAETALNFKFPDEPLNGETLPTIYRSLRIVSYQPTPPRSLRVWAGSEGDGEPSGLVGGGKVDQRQTKFSFPAFIGADLAASKNSIHPIDGFFSQSVADMKVLGEDMVEGNHCIVLEHRAKQDVTQIFGDDESGLTLELVQTAWIAVNQGCIPLRIAMERQWFHEGKSLSKGQSSPFQTVDVTNIEVLEGRYFYPMLGVVKNLIPDPDDPKWTLAGPTAKELREGKRPHIAQVVSRESSWLVHRIQLHPMMSDEMFAFDFPDQTPYFDEVAQKGLIQGVPEEELNRMIAEHDRVTSGDLAHEVPGRGTSRVFLVLVNLVIVGILIYIGYRARKNRGSSDADR